MTQLPVPHPTYDIPHRVRRFLEQIADLTTMPLTASEAQRLLDRQAPHTPLDDAMEIVVEIQACQQIQRELKAAFARSELDGGVKAAADHPLYILTLERIDSLRAELLQVI